MSIIGNMTGNFLGAVEFKTLEDTIIYFNNGKTVQVPTQTDVLRIYFRTDGVMNTDKDVLFRIDLYIRDTFDNGNRESTGCIVFNSIEEDEIPDEDKFTYIGNNNKMTIDNISENPNHSFYQFEIDGNIVCIFSEKGDLSEHDKPNAYFLNTFQELYSLKNTGYSFNKFTAKFETFLSKYPNIFYDEDLLDARVHGIINSDNITVYIVETKKGKKKYKIQHNEVLNEITIKEVSVFDNYKNIDTIYQNSTFSLKPATSYKNHKKEPTYVIELNFLPKGYADFCVKFKETI